MAVHTHISPLELASLDPALLSTLAAAAGDQWTQSDELLATVAELLHSLLLVTIRVNSKKGVTLPPPLHVRRPYESAPAPISPRQLFRHLSGG